MTLTPALNCAEIMHVGWVLIYLGVMLGIVVGYLVGRGFNK